MKALKALFVLQLSASVVAVPMKLADENIGVPGCSWNDRCFLVCSDVDSALQLTGIGICGVDWTSGLEWADNLIDVDGYDVGPNAGCGSTAASVVERELDVGAHADWKDELDIGAHVEWNNKAGAESEA